MAFFHDGRIDLYPVAQDILYSLIHSVRSPAGARTYDSRKGIKAVRAAADIWTAVLQPQGLHYDLIWN